MSKQYISTTDDDQNKLYINQALFGELHKLTRTNPHAVSVMLTLVANIGARGGVRVPKAALAHQYEITLQEVAKAIGDLESAGLIGFVDASTEPGGPLACVVNPSFARAEKPEEASSLSVAEGA
ncbi:hypothetical protein D3C77_173920 [compost metagenome]